MAVCLSFLDFLPGRVLAGIDGEENVVDRLLLFLGTLAFVYIGQFVAFVVRPYLW